MTKNYVLKPINNDESNSSMTRYHSPYSPSVDLPICDLNSTELQLESRSCLPPACHPAPTPMSWPYALANQDRSTTPRHESPACAPLSASQAPIVHLWAHERARLPCLSPKCTPAPTRLLRAPDAPAHLLCGFGAQVPFPLPLILLLAKDSTTTARSSGTRTISLVTTDRAHAP